MDLIFASQLLEVANLIADDVEQKHDAIKQQLNTIQAALDQLITREIKGGYEALANANISSHPTTKEKYLSFAEDCFLKNTSLDPQLQTNGKMNGYFIALAYYGLAILTAERGDLLLSARHLIRVFEFDPRSARTQLAPKVFEQYFKCHCSRAYEIGEREYKKTVERNYNAAGDGVLGRIGSLATWIGGVIGTFAIQNPAAFVTAEKESARLWKENSPEKLKAAAIAKAEEYGQYEIDRRCCEIALEMMSRIQ